jgi:hypothetical protein
MSTADFTVFARRMATAVQATEKMLRTALTFRGMSQDTALWEAIDAYATMMSLHAVAMHRRDTGCAAGLPPAPDLDHGGDDTTS